MGWDLALAATATYAKPEQFETFRRHIDAAWIDGALTATGTATVCGDDGCRSRRSCGSCSVWRSFATVRSKPS